MASKSGNNSSQLKLSMKQKHRTDPSVTRAGKKHKKKKQKSKRRSRHIPLILRSQNRGNNYALMLRAENSLGIFMYPYPIGYRIPKLKYLMRHTQPAFVNPNYYLIDSIDATPLEIPVPNPNVRSIILNYYGDCFDNGVIRHCDFNTKKPSLYRDLRQCSPEQRLTQEPDPDFQCDDDPFASKFQYKNNDNANLKYGTINAEVDDDEDVLDFTVYDEFDSSE